MSSCGLKDLSKDELLGLVEQLLLEVSALRERVSALEAENAALREENVRLKGLKGRPKLKPSGMEQATNRPKGKRKKGKRASRQSPRINEEHKLSLDAPADSRFKGYDDFVVQDLRLEGRVIRYRRERWLTPAGKLLVAPLPAGLRGHFGPELVRFILLQHHQGQAHHRWMTLADDQESLYAKVAGLATGGSCGKREAPHEPLIRLAERIRQGSLSMISMRNLCVYFAASGSGGITSYEQ